MVDDNFGYEVADRLMHVDVRSGHEFSHEVPEWAREQGRIDWKVRCSENMKKMERGEVTPIYQK